ncbi:hypothetical protein ACP6H7_00620 [Vibrio harveyi]|uniref:hypothetical protein n=1 Tax=Vibrio harveyi TaxID=669 RepID=UPI003CF71BA5
MLLMKLTKEQIREARIELAAMGFKAAITQLVRRGMREKEAIKYLANETENIEEVIITATKRGLPSYLVTKVISALKKKGVAFYKHQLSPTYEVVEGHAFAMAARKKQCS